MDPENTPSPDSVVLEQGTPEYDAAMIAKFDDSQKLDSGDQTEQTGTQEDRPDWLDPKFQTPEDLMKAYRELEKKQSQGTAPKADETPTPEAEAQKLVTDAGLDFDAFTSKFAQNGELSDEDYAALEGAKIPRAMVDAYIEGQKAIAQSHRSTLLSVVGGEEGFTSVSTWAADALDADDITAFNSVMDSGDLGAMKLALAGLKAQYDAENGSEPKLLTTDNSASSADVFRSSAELTAAMKDPRYARDPAYRRDIEQKLARSNNVF
jgi:hypothetical protein